MAKPLDPEHPGRFSSSLVAGLAMLTCFTAEHPVRGIADMAAERVPRTQMEERCRTSRLMWCCMGDGGAGWSLVSVALCGRFAGGGRKPPRAAAIKSRGGERRGKGTSLSVLGVDHEGERKRTTDEVSKAIIDDIRTGVCSWLWDKSDGCLLTGQAVSGMKVARAWSWLLCGTWEPVAPRPQTASGAGVARGRVWEGDPRAAETVRGRVPMWGTGADRLVVAVMPGNAGGAKGTGCPGLFGGQPLLAGGAG